MTKYYLCDDSCAPMDMDSLSIEFIENHECRDDDFTYDSPEDLIATLERKIKELRWIIKSSI
jgi:hypothetical protein